MEFNKNRVFTSLNADELRAGDKVIVSYNLYGLKEQVKMFTESVIDVIEVIQDEDYFNRFKIKHGESFPLAYLVERAENCTNCGAEPCGYRANHDSEDNKINKCPLWFQPKTEQKAEPHYRPFKDTDELIKEWDEKFYLNFKPSHDPLTMPLIWVRSKFNKDHKGVLISNYFGEYVELGKVQCFLSRLFDEYVFLDGSICGVEE